MVCPNCGGKTKVKESRADSDVIYRRRRCIDCNYIFYTEEVDSESAKAELNRFRTAARSTSKVKK